MTIRGNGLVEVSTDDTTLGGAKLVIVSANNGMYKIEARGEGAPPALCDQFFTNIPFAKRAIERYMAMTAGDRLKKETMKAGVERRKAAFELKNGELDKTVNGE